MAHSLSEMSSLPPLCQSGSFPTFKVCFASSSFVVVVVVKTVSTIFAVGLNKRKHKTKARWESSNAFIHLLLWNTRVSDTEPSNGGEEVKRQMQTLYFRLMEVVLNERGDILDLIYVSSVYRTRTNNCTSIFLTFNNIFNFPYWLRSNNI